MYACMYVSYTRGVEKKKKREKRNAGGKTSAIRKIELIFLPIDALLFQREREREGDLVPISSILRWKNRGENNSSAL